MDFKDMFPPEIKLKEAEPLSLEMFKTSDDVMAEGYQSIPDVTVVVSNKDFDMMMYGREDMVTIKA